MTDMFEVSEQRRRNALAKAKELNKARAAARMPTTIKLTHYQAVRIGDWKAFQVRKETVKV